MSVVGSRAGWRVIASTAVSVLALAALAVSPASAITIEIDDVASDRVERQRAFAEGALPLAGTPDLGQLGERLKAKGLAAGAALFIRVFKAESELEVWMRKGDEFELFATYPICHWAGTIGPKLREGDKQNPEGFYSVGARQLHRIGRWPRSLNLGFPNTFDRAHGRTGSYILVHGGCSSAGCFAMTNAVMAEIFSLTESALRAGQGRVDVHVFPFRMTDANLKTHEASPWIDFWRNLREGYDAFEQTKLPPRVGICDRRYVIEPQRPGEVGADGPLALCGVSRAALIEPSSRSIADLPPDWPQAPSRAVSLPPVERQALSGRPLPPLPSLDQQAALLPPRVHRPRNPKSGPAGGLPIAQLRSTMQEPLPCNPGLASCRKFLALRSVRDQRHAMLAGSPQASGRGVASRAARRTGAALSAALRSAALETASRRGVR